MPINEHGDLDFPENPKENDIFVDVNNTQWKYSGTQWGIFEPYYITDLPDVDIVDPKVGDVMEWNGTHWTQADEITDLNSLEDVTLTNPQDGDFLVFSGTEYVNKPIVNPQFCSVSHYGLISNDNTTGYANPKLIEYDTVEYDPSNLWDAVNFKMVINNTGLYSIYCTYATQQLSPHMMIIKIYDSGDTLKEEIPFRAGLSYLKTTPNYINGQTLHYKTLNSGDYIKVYHVRNKRTDATDPTAYTKEHQLVIEQI